MTDTTYNGWKNYPTWAVNMWLSNDEALYDETTNVAVGYVEREHGRYEFAEYLKDWVEDMGHELMPDATFAADLLGYALALVDWAAIAAHWIDDAQETLQSR